MKLRWLLALALPACTPQAALEGGLGRDAVSALVIVDGPDGRTVAGVEGAPFSYQEHTAEAVTVTVLEYAFPLEALGLREGPIDLLLAGQEGLHPPVPAAARRAVLDGSGTFALEPILVTDVDLEPLLLEVPSRPACIEGGGCLVARPIDDVLVCRTPCPEPPEPTPPMPPTPPELGPCLAGWVTVPPATDDDVPECAPWAASSECETGTAQRPGEATCTLVGAACPTSGRFAPGLPDDGSVRFVDSSAAPGGTGTRAAPFARLDDALAGAGSSTVTVALSVGAHAAPAAWPAQVELRGACAAQTSLTGLEHDEGSLRVEDLSVTGFGLRVAGGGLTLAGVVVAPTVSPALRVSAGHVTLDDAAVVARTGFAVEVLLSGRLTARRVRVDGGGLRFDGDSQGDLRQVAVVASSFGLGVLGRAQVELEGLAVEAARVGGVSVVEEGRLAARHLWTEAGPGSSGHVVVVGEKAYANLRNVRIRGGVIAGLDVAEGEVDVTDAVIRDIQPSPTDLRGGSGIIVRAGGQVRLERGVLLRTRGYGVEARDTESLAEVIDVRVTDVPGWVADGDNGIGLGADSLAEIHVSRVQVERVHGFGALLRGGLLTGDDLLVQQMLPQDANDAYGRGLEFGRSAVVDLTRVWVRDAMNIGVLCLDIGTRVTLRDLRVDRTTRSPACHEFSCNTGAADGLTAMLEADVSATRFLIQDNGQYGVRVVNRTVLLLRDGRVARNAVGAQVINADFDLSNLMEGVVYEDNPEPVSVLSD